MCVRRDALIVVNWRWLERQQPQRPTQGTVEAREVHRVPQRKLTSHKRGPPAVGTSERPRVSL
eukprot:7353519-Prymnesium_polylepis.1